MSITRSILLFTKRVSQLLLFCIMPFCWSWIQTTPHHIFERAAPQTHCGMSSTSSPDDERRRKKNKYSKFSKADKLVQDPFEALVAQSAKVLELDNKTKKRKRGSNSTTNDEPRTRNQVTFPDTRSIDPCDPSTYGYTDLGTVIGAHGVRGEIKVDAVTEFQERLCRPGLRHIKAPNRRSPRPVTLLEGRLRLKDEYLVKLEGIDDRDAANKLRGSVLYAREEDRPTDLDQDEYLVGDLVGLEVFVEEDYDSADLAGKFVGAVAGVILAEDMCAVPGLGQDMLEIVLSRGPGRTASWKDELVLIPFVPQIVPRVDVKGGSIHITPPLGLLDLTYVREEKVRIKGFLPPGKDQVG